MGQTAVTAEVPVTPVYTTQVSVSEVLQQIAEFVRVNVSQDTTSLEMQLNPENLGKLYLHISSNREGSITAQFTADLISAIFAGALFYGQLYKHLIKD